MNRDPKSGAIPLHARKMVVQWNDGQRVSRLEPELLDVGWRGLQPSDRTPIKGHVLGGGRGLRRRHGYDPHKTDYLVKGFTEGFHLRLDAPVHLIAEDLTTTSLLTKSNHKSARVNPEAVGTKLCKKIRAKGMIGPFSSPVCSTYMVSPSGLREKKSPGKFRVIHNLSAPFVGPSVNSHIPTAAGSVSYDTVDTAISLIQAVGPRAFLAKTDIEHAYKLIPILPADITALGIRWFGDWLWDCTLPMGSRSGCAIFKAFSHTIQFLSEARGCGDMSHMLDDFLMVSPDKHISDNRLSRFLALCELLGIPVVWEKTESGTCIIFLGITLDTIKMEVRLPQEKLDKCLRLITAYRQLQKISIKQLESLTGLLNFACKVIHPGRPYNLMEGFRHRLPFYKLCLTAGAKEDTSRTIFSLNSDKLISFAHPTTSSVSAGMGGK